MSDYTEKYVKKIREVDFDASVIPRAHIPTPTELDYTIGFIKRYFCQKVNSSTNPIFEVNVDEYHTLIKNPYYITTTLEWRITGTNEELEYSNRVSTAIAARRIPRLSLYLPNLLQFRKK
jgi:hypothetical protein